MANPQKAKGSEWERRVAAYFNERGYVNVERRYGAGNTKDKGDLNGFAGEIVIECKDHKSISLSTFMDETETEKENAKAKLGLCVAKRARKPVDQAYCILTLKDVITLLQEAGY